MTEQPYRGRVVTPEEMRDLGNANGGWLQPPVFPTPDQEPESGPEEEQPVQDEDIPRYTKEQWQQMMEQRGLVTRPALRQQFAQLAGDAPEGKALIEWSKGTLFGVTIGITLGAGIAYLVVRNAGAREESSESGDSSESSS
jgi:hypothetical protein